MVRLAGRRRGFSVRDALVCVHQNRLRGCRLATMDAQQRDIRERPDGFGLQMQLRFLRVHGGCPLLPRKMHQSAPSEKQYDSNGIVLSLETAEGRRAALKSRCTTINYEFVKND